MLSWVSKQYLSHERGVFLVLEVLRQYFTGELGEVLDDEAVATLAPRHDMREFCALRQEGILRAWRRCCGGRPECSSSFTFE